MRVNKNIKVSRIDRERYIDQTFVSNSGLRAICLGVYDIYHNSIKRYLVKFEDGRFGVAEGRKLRIGEFAPIKDKNQPDTKPTEDEKLVNEFDKQKKKIQRLQDENRILRKIDRGMYRTENIVEEVINGLRDALREHDYKFQKKHKKLPKVNNKVALCQISDVHAGQEVELPVNKYNMEIFRDRLLTYADRSIEKIKSQNITEVCIAFGGDLTHLDSRLDMLLTSQYNRSQAFLMIYDILSEFILRYLEEGFDVKLVSVLGNESRLRVYDHFSNIEKIASDNLDFMLFQLLKRRFENSVHFMNEGDELEALFQLNGKWIASTHGAKLKHNNLTDEVIKFKLRCLESYGIMPDYVLVHHIHSPIITHLFSRNASLVGANGYSEKGLNIPSSSVSQNLIIIGDTISAEIIDCREEL